LKKTSKKNVIYFHNLSTATQAQTAYSVTAKGRKSEGKIRLLKESENIGWRDAKEYEEVVYNEIIKNKEDKVEYDIYGTILQDGKFRIIDKTTEDVVATKDTRKLNRGRICFNGWKKKELVDLMWKLDFNPFKIKVDEDKNSLIAFMVSQGIATKKEALKFTDKQLKFYYIWYTSGSSIEKMCELLEKYFEETDRLIKS